MHSPFPRFSHETPLRHRPTSRNSSLTFELADEEEPRGAPVSLFVCCTSFSLRIVCKFCAEPSRDPPSFFQSNLQDRRDSLLCRRPTLVLPSLSVTVSETLQEEPLKIGVAVVALPVPTKKPSQLIQIQHKSVWKPRTNPTVHPLRCHPSTSVTTSGFHHYGCYGSAVRIGSSCCNARCFLRHHWQCVLLLRWTTL